MRTENLTVKREWYENGQILSEEYLINGKRHNTEGPAYRKWDENGQIRYEVYWINGKQLSKEEWENEVKKDTCNGKIVEIDGKKYKLQVI